MKAHLFSFIASLLTASVAFPQTKDPVIDPSLPNVLLIGDSISGGYQKQVKQALTGKANVIKNEGNAEWTGTGIKKIDSYLGDTKWDIIHFNWGLWDIYGWEYDAEDRSPEAYAKRLDQLVTRMKQTGAKLIWATTTPACKEVEQTMLKRFKKEVIITPEQQAKYSDAALEVMKKHSVEINDLHAYILPTLDKHSEGPDDVHFTGGGNGHLAQKVVATLEEALKSVK
ncbi:MAG: SGNH/GDSL hydrolase family protein [Verrucomicrobiota bacterium]